MWRSTGSLIRDKKNTISQPGVKQKWFNIPFNQFFQTCKKCGIYLVKTIRHVKISCVENASKIETFNFVQACDVEFPSGSCFL